MEQDRKGFFIGRNDFSSGYPRETIDPRFSIPKNIYPPAPEDSEPATVVFSVGSDGETVLEKREITRENPMITVFKNRS